MAVGDAIVKSYSVSHPATNFVDPEMLLRNYFETRNLPGVDGRQWNLHKCRCRTFVFQPGLCIIDSFINLDLDLLNIIKIIWQDEATL